MRAGLKARLGPMEWRRWSSSVGVTQLVCELWTVVFCFLAVTISDSVGRDISGRMELQQGALTTGTGIGSIIICKAGTGKAGKSHMTPAGKS